MQSCRQGPPRGLAASRCIAAKNRLYFEGAGAYRFIYKTLKKQQTGCSGPVGIPHQAHNAIPQKIPNNVAKRLKMKILYYDCFAGISGDMHLGAMIDAGVDPEHLFSELGKLPVSGFKLNIARDKKQGIEGTRVDVATDEHAHPPHRNLDDIEQIIAGSGLAEGTRQRARRMFHLIAEAESKIHGVPVNKIHFHEVGALDSIVDIIGAAICLEYLSPDRILSSTVELGSGTVRCAHGTMPVPAPATAEILKDIPVRIGGTGHEATTPTGAAILAANVDEFTDRADFRPELTAYGIGHRDAGLPNVLRVIVATASDTAASSTAAAGVWAAGTNTFAATASETTFPDGNRVMIECQTDDMNPEHYPHIMDLLLSMGADDVCLTPTIMKKGRPGVLLSVLCAPELQDALSVAILKETSTLGVRRFPVSRMILERKTELFTSTLGPVTFKISYLEGRILKWKPEYEDCKKLALRHGMPLQDVTRTVQSEFSAGSSRSKP